MKCRSCGPNFWKGVCWLAFVMASIYAAVMAVVLLPVTFSIAVLIAVIAYLGEKVLRERDQDRCQEENCVCDKCHNDSSPDAPVKQRKGTVPGCSECKDFHKIFKKSGSDPAYAASLCSCDCHQDS